MRNKEFYVVHSHYNKNGYKSRFVERVKGEIFLYEGYSFGLYYNEKEGLWKLVDVVTGKQLASGVKKEFTRSRIMIPQVFYDYEARTKTKDYKGLMQELADLIEKYLKDNPPPSSAAMSATTSAAAPILRDPKEADMEELKKRFCEAMDFETMKNLGSKGGLS